MQRYGALLAALALGLSVTGCANDATPPSSSAIRPTESASLDRNNSEDQNDEDDDDGRAFTLAVIGDTPYGDAKLAEFPSLIAKINADRAVERVIHVGDIKAGKNSDCSDAYFDTVRGLFDTFQYPLVYTPGDNEWTDCHVATKNNGLYTPTERLQRVRKVFFPIPGRTLAVRREVATQASDKANSQYVENVQWKRNRVVFATLNITGSNNDGVSWGTPLPANAGNYPSQATEQATRAQANKAWLERTFAIANQQQARAVVLIFQADMWDAAEPSLTGYDALVQQIGNLAIQFKRPVLLLEGDSHVFTVDNPYSASSLFYSLHPSTPLASNVKRIVVEGSDKGRTEYVRLTIDSKKADPFTYERVPLN